MLLRRLVIEWIAVLLSASLFVGWAAMSDMTQRIDNMLFDAVSPLQAGPVDPRILLVNIDNESLESLGRWPWPRTLHATAISKLTEGGAAAIAYDVLFLERDAADPALADAMAQAKSVYLPGLDEQPGQNGAAASVQLPPEPLRSVAAGIGSAEIVVDEDGQVRRMPLPARRDGGTLPHLMDLVAQQILGRPLNAFHPGEPILIPFHHRGSFASLPFRSLVAGEVPPAFLRNKIVLVGADADGLGDLFPVAAASATLMSGTEIQANLLDALLTGHDIRPLSLFTRLLLSLLPVWLLLLAFWRFRPTTNLRLSIFAMLATVATSAVLLGAFGLWLPPTPALLGLTLVYSLWGWRRLEAVSQFIANEVRILQADHEVLPIGSRTSWRGDSVNAETSQLHGVIDQLRTLQRFIAEVVERLPDAVCVVGEDDVVTLGNEAASHLFGVNVRGMPFADLLARLGSPDDHGELETAEGHICVMAEAPLTTGGRIVRFTDITRMRSVEREREEALQFLSHDMRSPHAAILTLLESRNGTPPDPPADLFDRVRRYARHGLKMADDFVRLARLRTAPIASDPVDIVDAAAEAADIIWPMAQERKITLDDACDDTEAWVMGDRALLVRAIHNLLDNGVKFAPEGSVLRYGVTVSGEVIEVRIAGLGPKIPQDRQDNLFGRFGPGRHGAGLDSIGLGLAFVQAAVRRHGGTVRYEGEDDHHVFIIELPLLREDDEA